jgi:predicted dehydrogenase
VNDRARRLLLPGLAASPAAEVVAVCSRDATKGQAAAHAVNPAVRAFRSLEALVTARLADVVYLNTPLETHVLLATTALRAGYGVICEKPLAPSAKEAEELASEAERAGMRTVVNFTYRSVPGYRLTERLLADDRGAGLSLGRPLHARFELLQGHNFLPDFPPASALLDSGSHLFDLMGALLPAAGFGEIVQVCGGPLSKADPDYGWAFGVRTQSGVVAQALFSRSAPGWRNGLRWSLAGEAGALEVELDSDRTSARTATPGDGAPQGVWREIGIPEDVAVADARFPAYHMGRLVRAIRGEEAFPGFAEAILANRFAEALAQSARTGAWVSV